MWRTVSFRLVARRLDARLAILCAPANLCVLSCVSRACFLSARFCSATTGSFSSGTQQGFPSCTSLSSPAAPPCAADSNGALAASNTAAERSIEEQLKSLSAEDQQLILDALRNPSGQKTSTMGGEGIGPKDANMVAAFTCGKCDFRMVKRFSKHAYTKGIVIVECPNCRVKHLLADNLGWIEDEATNVEDFLKEKGEQFIHIGGGDYEVKPE